MNELKMHGREERRKGERKGGGEKGKKLRGKEERSKGRTEGKKEGTERKLGKKERTDNNYRSYYHSKSNSSLLLAWY